MNDRKAHARVHLSTLWWSAKQPVQNQIYKKYTVHNSIFDHKRDADTRAEIEAQDMICRETRNERNVSEP